MAAAALAAPLASAGSHTPAVKDSKPPVGTILVPRPGSWVNRALIRVEFLDPDGINIDSIEVRIDGNPMGFSWDGFAVFAASDRVPDGLHSAEVSAWDNLGNGPTILSWSFSLDTTRPLLNVTYPVGNPVLADGSVTLAWTGSDSGSGIGQYRIRLDDGPFFGVGTVTSFPFHGLGVGVHYFSVTATDVAGNTNDNEAPVAVATVLAPPAGPAGNTTNQLTVVVPDQIPAWAIALVAINAIEAAAVAWLAMWRLQESFGGGKGA